MTDAKPLIDTLALGRRRERAMALGPADFLHRIAAAECAERIAEINRGFRKCAVVGWMPDPWLGAFPGAAFVPDSETLDFPDPPLDLVIHAMSLHWANDPVGQLIQCRLALKPDGLFIGAMLGGGSLAELRESMTEAESRAKGGLSPRFLPMAHIRDAGALLPRAGFALPVADSLRQVATYESPRRLMLDLRLMGETCALSARPRALAARALFHEAERVYRGRFGLGDGRIPATFELMFLTGWSPAPGQQKPLRPGSALKSLSEALGSGGPGRAAGPDAPGSGDPAR